MEPFPPWKDNDSEDETYQGNDRGNDRGRIHKRNTRSRQNSSEIIKDIEAQNTPDESGADVHYILDRGNDFSDSRDRSNRWTGTPSGYRKLIAQEKGVYESLAFNRSRNLANHLYNAFVLRHPSKALKTENEEDGEVATFERRWVAWPMPAATVPCPGESLYRKQADLDMYGRRADFRPSADLEESVIASMMNTAHERFRAREWDSEALKPNREARSVDPNEMVTSEDEKKNDDHAIISGAQYHRPAIQSDDDISRRQLLPLSRNVISQVDKLLMGLHHSIRNRLDDLDSSDDSATDEETSFSRSNGKRKGIGRRKSRNRGRDRKRVKMDHQDEEPGDIDQDTLEADYRPSTLDRMELRDWSEVMGIASMIGLPQNAVKRASRRCADLFNQDMTFRTFHEGRVKPVGRLPGSTMNYAYFEEDETDNYSILTQNPRAPSKSKKTPSSQSRKAHSTILALSQPAGSQSRPQSNSVPASSFPPPTKGTTALPEFSQPVISGNLAAPVKPDGHYCPFPKCDKHTHPFPRIWNFKLHLQRKHPSYYETVKDSLVIRKKR